MAGRPEESLDRIPATCAGRLQYRKECQLFSSEREKQLFQVLLGRTFPK